MSSDGYSQVCFQIQQTFSTFLWLIIYDHLSWVSPVCGYITEGMCAKHVNDKITSLFNEYHKHLSVHSLMHLSRQRFALCNFQGLLRYVLGSDSCHSTSFGTQTNALGVKSIPRQDCQSWEEVGRSAWQRELRERWSCNRETQLWAVGETASDKVSPKECRQRTSSWLIETFCIHIS